VTFASMAKPLKNSRADSYTIQAPSASSLGNKAPTSATSGVSLAPSKASPTSASTQEDRRLLVPIKKTALLNQPLVFLLQQELCLKIPRLTLGRIPLITPTRTGWAINLVDLTTRDLLAIEENVQIVKRILHRTAIRQLEKWFNYAVTGVPLTIQHLLGGTVVNTFEIVLEEVLA
jgi:hypothetical protein